MVTAVGMGLFFWAQALMLMLHWVPVVTPIRALDPWMRRGRHALHVLRHYIAIVVAILGQNLVLAFLHSDIARIGGLEGGDAFAKHAVAYFKYSQRLLRMAFLVAACIAGEKFVVQQMALHFHSNHQLERIRRNNFAARCLAKMLAFFGIRFGSSGFGLSSPLASAKSPGSASGGGSAKVRLQRLGGQQEVIHRNSLYTGGLEHSMLIEESAESVEDLFLLSKQELLVLAGRLWDAMTVQRGRIPLLTMADVVQILGDLDDSAERFMDLLQKSGESDAGNDSSVGLTRNVFLKGIGERVYDDRQGILTCLTANSFIIKRIDEIAVYLAAFLGIYLSLGQLFDSGWIPAAIAVAMTFLHTELSRFGGAVESVISSLIFVLFCHPFDVGDVIAVEGAWYKVITIELSECLMLALPSNQLTLVKNCNLCDSFIANPSRSSDTTEAFTVPLLGEKCTSAQIRKLESLVHDFTGVHEADFVARSTRIIGIRMISHEILNIDFEVCLRGNLAEGRPKDLRMNNLMQFIREDALKIVGNLELAPVNWDY